MRAIPWLIGGGLAYALTRSRRFEPVATPFTGDLAGRWVWPVPRYQGRKPVISNGFGAKHAGVDVMFPRLASDSLDETKGYVMPDLDALAASDGIVWSAGETPRGLAVVIDHAPRKVATFYTHLSKLHVAKGDHVRAGQPLGVIGADPLDPEHVKHLHFELWLGGPTDSIDPQLLMSKWDALPSPEQLVARNASFVYRPLGESGDAYPEWVRALKGKAGVYVIRDAKSGATFYVGSSSTNLYATLTRHFQTWRRWKGFWRGQYGEGHDPGLTYARNTVLVAVRTTSPSKALDEEMRLIGRMQPRDNIIGQKANDEEVPF